MADKQKSRSKTRIAGTEAAERLAWQPKQTTSLGRTLELECQQRIWDYQDTGNPLHAWAALSKWSAAQFASHRRDGPARFDMPEPLCIFLFRMSQKMTSLASGVRPKQYRSGELIQNDPDQPDPTPAERLSLVPVALELSEKKWNAFAAFNAEEIAQALAEIRDAVQKEGGTYEQAMEAVAEAIGTSDERTARRRLAGGRRPDAIKAPWRRNRTGAE